MAGMELTFDEKDFIVSKTDLSGKIIYGNEVFIEMSGFSESELLGQPHNILRHPEMPASVFKFLWEKIKNKEEVFAYVINKTKQDNYYWVMAHITPSMNDQNELIAYHSVRRKPSPAILEQIKPIYRSLLEAEKRGGIRAGIETLTHFLNQRKVSYDEFILSL
ncbi:PAS domain-containing protein [Sulfuricurvum sp.]|uniref:PAS domain-containing protein n=1 Tax=Sulfuricurvum sp. TaxID=2025608 RepID=UPI002E33F493|nr:PAS domain-containing protein [Sulfuricurvum sp.]HEX5329767.1 PAS domain-containing protein [Sulfuricurvum sp.]